MSLPEVIQPETTTGELAIAKLAYSGIESPRQMITRAVWNSVATFASVAGALRLTAIPQRLVCAADTPVRARRSFAGVALPRKNSN